MMNAAFTAHEIAVNGKTFPVEYSISPSGTVFAFVTVQENGQPVSLRIKIDPADPNHAAALAAAQQERNEAHTTEPEAPTQQEQAEAPEASTEPKAPAPVAEPEASTQQEQTETPEASTEPEAPAPVAEPEASTQQEQTEAPNKPETPAQQDEATEEPARNPKQARGPVPEKNFIGLEIKGNGWEIVFDGSYGRTRVIFKRKPSMKAREAVENAGFFWSPAMQSWNKKLTFKAWRAAQTLAMELKTICG